ncbi:bidirectional sugar transporter SWEET5-like [Coffea arabica]|uniref:Bidirectional sugar transporter SWEET5-like n=1 Tax=Coffea arabica TaxID=13443 RepID=A0ABM4U5G6_COFAR
MGEVVVSAIVIGITLGVWHDEKQRSIFVGVVCMFLNIFMYLSPLTVMIPNGIGTLSGLFQLALYAWYYRSTNWEDDDNIKKPSEIQFSVQNARV